MSHICLLAPGQPSTDPRLVKEADALHEAGHEVRVICSHYIRWADAADRDLLRTRSWTCTYVGGNSNGSGLNAWWTRTRHGIARSVPQAWPLSKALRHCALCRVSPELAAAARQLGADLYIAHYTGALAAAAQAARAHGSALAYDAEDFETGSYALGDGPTAMDRLIERVEREYLPRCAYVTAASDGIAEAYQQKYGIELPTTILNVFPLSERPAEFRPTPQNGPLRLYWFSQTIGPDRGLQDIVCALGELRHCNIQLHLRGRWASGFQTQLFTLADSVGLLRDRIQAHAPASAPEMVRLAAEYEVGLALERQEKLNRDICLTNKIFTYLLAGNAVIATATAGQRSIMQIIVEAGFTYRPGDIDALVRNLRLWYENRDALEQARRRSWGWATCRFNWDLEKAKFLRTVEKALDIR